MWELHRRSNLFHETNSLISYKECLSIIAEEMNVEKEHQDVMDIISNSVIDISNVDV